MAELCDSNILSSKRNQHTTWKCIFRINDKCFCFEDYICNERFQTWIHWQQNNMKILLVVKIICSLQIQLIMMNLIIWSHRLSKYHDNWHTLYENLSTNRTTFIKIKRRNSNYRWFFILIIHLSIFDAIQLFIYDWKI
jgi:hypothetical protein